MEDGSTVIPTYLHLLYSPANANVLGSGNISGETDRLRVDTRCAREANKGEEVSRRAAGYLRRRAHKAQAHHVKYVTIWLSKWRRHSIRLMPIMSSCTRNNTRQQYKKKKKNVSREIFVARIFYI